VRVCKVSRYRGEKDSSWQSSPAAHGFVDEGGHRDWRGRAGRPSKEIVRSQSERKQEYSVNREVYGVRTPLDENLSADRR
jgi:hypothetical protein